MTSPTAAERVDALIARFDALGGLEARGFVLELSGLGGREALAGHEVFSLITA